jgi:hypothetical protein
MDNIIIKIKYTPSRPIKKESITINIENTTFGALCVFLNDLQKICPQVKEKESLTQEAYRELIEFLAKELENELINKN